LLRAASCICVTVVTAACFTLPATETVTSEAPATSAANAPVCDPAAIVVDSKLLNDRSLAETLREYEGWWPAEMRAYPVPLAYPGITNLTDVNKAMENALPTGMSDNAVTGTTIFAVLIDVEGSVRNAKIVQRSGERGIDQAATRALPVARFNPMRAPSGCRAMHLVRVPLHFSSRAPAP
jgi:TonB family protein